MPFAAFIAAGPAPELRLCLNAFVHLALLSRSSSAANSKLGIEARER